MYGEEVVIPPAWVSGKSPTVFCSDEFGGTKIGRSRWGEGGALGSIWP